MTRSFGKSILRVVGDRQLDGIVFVVMVVVLYEVFDMMLRD